MSDITLNRKLFDSRMARLIEEMKSSPLWSSVNSLIILVGSSSTFLPSLPALFHMWIFEYELSDTLLVFKNESMWIASSQKKVDILKSLSDSSIKIELMTRTRDNTQEVIDTMKKWIENTTPGIVNGDPHSSFGTDVMKAINEIDKKVNVSSALSALICEKDENEINKMRDAARFTAISLKKGFVPKMEDMLNEQEYSSHSDISQKVKTSIENPSSIGLGSFPPDNIELLKSPTITSGYKNCLKTILDDCDKNLMSDNIIQCALCPLVSVYSAPFARTYFINASEDLINTYNVANDLFTYLLSIIVPGITLGDVYDKAMAFIKEKASDLIPYCPKNFGYACGLSPYDTNLEIGPNVNVPVKKGMTFVIIFSIANYIKKSAESDKPANPISFFIADPIVVENNASVELYSLPRKFTSVSYSLDNEEEEDVVESVKKEANDLDKNAIRETRLRNPNKSNEEREKHQKELSEKLKQELLQRAGFVPTKKQIEADKGPAYKSVSHFPRDVNNSQVYVDASKEVVLCPIFGVLVPFKISLIKNVTIQENELRINFNQTSSTDSNSTDENSFASYIRELTYIIKNTAIRNQIERKLKEVKKRITLRNSEVEGDEIYVEHEKLALQRGRVFKLLDVNVNPPLSGRRCIGTLESHLNGFRFTSNKGVTLDILYKNIRFAFFQKAETELIVLIHFRLRQPIVVGKKKTIDVQFFTEIADFSSSTERRSVQFDDEEIEEEQRAREKKRRLNREFENFCTNVQDSVKNFEFDTPFRELGFSGVPDRSNVDLFPTANCIVSLTEQPFFILPVQDVEIAVFERVGPRVRNFDLVIVFKDYNKPTQKISNIPNDALEQLHDWFDTLDIKYYDLATPLDWKKIMSYIIDLGAKRFVEEQNGWDFLDMNDADESESESDVESDFEPNPDEIADDDDDDISDFDENEDESSEESYEEESSDEGENWEELEKEAMKADKAKRFEEEERRMRRK